MTIRYKCEECESVLKIRDELAGTSAKCPKCKVKFVIPAAGPVATDTHTDGDGAADAATESGETAEDLTQDPVDMPREITPLPQLVKRTDSDRLTDAPAAAEDKNELKPSVAELMREHEAKKKKKKDKTEKGGLAEASLAAEVMTSGTAADALTRNYDQKRGKASEPPPMTREERRQAEQREAAIGAAKKYLPIFAGVCVLGYFFLNWFWSQPLPDLEYVSGVVTFNGAPLADVAVTFSPVPNESNASNKDAKKNNGMRNASMGYTDPQGKYVLMYDLENRGAVLGEHNVSIVSGDGVSFTIPSMESRKEVTTGDNTFDFQL